MVTTFPAVCVVHFENSSLPRIWKVSSLVFIFNLLFHFTLNKMMVIGKLLSPFVIQTDCEQTAAIITPTFYSKYDMVEISFVRNFFVQKARNQNYGKSFKFHVYEIIIRSVQLVGYSP